METGDAYPTSPISPEAKKPVRTVIPKIALDADDPGRSPLVISLPEDEYRKVLLVKTVIDVEPRLLPPGAVEEAESALKGEDLSQRSILPMADVLLSHLPSAYRRLTAKSPPWSRLRLIVPLLAFLVGALSNVLSPLGLEKVHGPHRAIHILVNPIVMLILWNIVVVSIFILLNRRSGAARSRDDGFSLQKDIPSRHRDRRPPEPELPLWAQMISRPFLKLWARFVEPVSGGTSTPATHAKIAGVFLSRYFQAYREAVVARIEKIINVSAICLAAGAIAGMYIQAVVWDYSFFWKSTLIESSAARLIIAKVLFWPAALLLGRGFPNAEVITAMAQGTGVTGAIWIHVFAVAATAYIFIPRSILVYRYAAEARKALAAKAITIDFVSVRVLEPPEPSGNFQPGEFYKRLQTGPGQAMAIDYFLLDANALSVLTSFQAAMIERDIEGTGAGNLLGDALSAKRTWYLEWLRLIKAGFVNLPEEVRPSLYPVDSFRFNSAVAGLSRCPNPFVRDLILLELAAFEAYWPMTTEKKDWTQKLGDLTRLTPSLSKEVVANVLENAAYLLGLPKGKGPLLRSELQSVNRALSGYWERLAIIAGIGTAAGALTFGIAAPIIGGLIGHAMGLAGAAAVKAGLAAMGCGAIASGGMGIAGGTAVIVGGGALLGIGVGSSVAAMMNPAGALIQAVKIEVFLRFVVAEYVNAKQVVNDVLRQLQASIENLKGELAVAGLNPEIGNEYISGREEIIKILGTCLKRCTEWAKEKAIRN